jgi:hypothetical protein
VRPKSLARHSQPLEPVGEEAPWIEREVDRQAGHPTPTADEKKVR